MLLLLLLRAEAGAYCVWLATAVCGWHTKHRLCTRGKDCGNGRERLAADQALKEKDKKRSTWWRCGSRWWMEASESGMDWSM